MRVTHLPLACKKGKRHFWHFSLVSYKNAILIRLGQWMFQPSQVKITKFHGQNGGKVGRLEWGKATLSWSIFEAWEIQFAWLSIRTRLSFHVIEYFKRFSLPPPPHQWQSVGLMSINVRVGGQIPRYPPPPLAVTQPLAIEVEIYLLIAWILLDFCLESWAKRAESCQAAAGCMCGSSHTPEHALHKDMRAVKRSISSEKEQEQEQLEKEQEQQRLARNFKFPGGF